MAANYNKLWKLLIDKGMTKTDLRMKTGMSTSTLAKMSKNENVSLDVILSICDVLECNVGDIFHRRVLQRLSTCHRSCSGKIVGIE